MHNAHSPRIANNQVLALVVFDLARTKPYISRGNDSENKINSSNQQLEYQIWAQQFIFPIHFMKLIVLFYYFSYFALFLLII